MGWYSDRLLPGVIDKMLDTGQARKHRSHIVPKATGRVVELGFGSGTNMMFYSDEVTEILAVDPALRGQELAAPRIADRGLPVRFIGLDGQSLPLEDASVDSVVATWTLCTIPDPAVALAESFRVLKPGGHFYYVEHGLHPDPTIAKWQGRIEPVWRRFSGGCHLTRDAESMVADAGFTHVESTQHMMAKSPKIAGHLYEGVAQRP